MILLLRAANNIQISFVRKPKRDFLAYMAPKKLHSHGSDISCFAIVPTLGVNDPIPVQSPARSDMIKVKGVHSLNIVFFPLKLCDVSEHCQFCCSAGVLPSWWVYTHTDTEGKQRKARVRNISKYSKRTQYLMNTL